MEVLKCVTLNHKIMNNPVKFTSFIAKSFLKQKSKKPYFTCKSNKNKPIIHRKIFNTCNSSDYHTILSINPFNPMCDQDYIAPYRVNIKSSRQVMKIKKNVN